MTVGEIERRMDSRELTEWIAYTQHYEALPDSWQETGLLAAALLAPHSPKGRAPKPDDFVPLLTPPQHESQVKDMLLRLRRELGQTDDDG